jgi:hypothetical protein
LGQTDYTGKVRYRRSGIYGIQKRFAHKEQPLTQSKRPAVKGFALLSVYRNAAIPEGMALTVCGIAELHRVREDGPEGVFILDFR